MPALNRCTVAYVLADDASEETHYLVLEPDEKAQMEGADHGSVRDRAAKLSVTFDGEVFDVRVKTFRDIRITECTLEARHHFQKTGRVLLNGYQSWTDTVETDIRSFRRGLRGLPRNLIKHFLLDTAGDYRFVHYGFARGRMHGWTYATMRRGGSVFLIGSLNEDDGFTLIRFDTGKNLIYIEKECPLRVIRAGEELTLSRIAAIMRESGDYPEGERTLVGAPMSIADAFDRWFELMGVKRLPALPMVGYSSWYRHFDSVDQEKVLDDLKAARAMMRLVDTTGFERVFQIDDGYAKVGDWIETYENKFPDGLAPLVRKIKHAGFKPGLWMAPFACELDSNTYLSHPDWLLRDDKGEPVRTGTHWNGGFALDTRNPEVRRFVTDIIHTVTREWGFELLKVDFLYAACMLPHAGMNRGQLMADAMQLLRDAAGPDVQLLGCGVPLASAFGRVEYCRIGCDVGLDWNNRFYYSVLSRERVSTKRSLANTVGRSPLNGRAFLNDPDVFFLREDVQMDRSQEELLLEGDACFGGALLTSDNMGVWTNEDVKRYQEAIDLMRTALGRFDSKDSGAMSDRSAGETADAVPADAAAASNAGTAEAFLSETMQTGVRR
ncbi:MAG: glycoside hydrolase family 36 protein [Eggerthellaceae bacterium]|jgi:alpha-galactosidase